MGRARRWSRDTTYGIWMREPIASLPSGERGVIRELFAMALGKSACSNCETIRACRRDGKAIDELRTAFCIHWIWEETDGIILLSSSHRIPYSFCEKNLFGSCDVFFISVEIACPVPLNRCGTMLCMYPMYVSYWGWKSRSTR